MRRRARERQEKREDRQPISKRLRAALLRGRSGSSIAKNGLYEGSARGNWDPRKGQQPFRPNPGLGPHHHVEAAVDWCSSILVAL